MLFFGKQVCLRDLLLNTKLSHLGPGLNRAEIPETTLSSLFIYLFSTLSSLMCHIKDSFPWRRKWQPTPVLLPGESHGQRSLTGYSPCGCEEADMTEQVTLSFTFKDDFGFWKKH